MKIKTSIRGIVNDGNNWNNPSEADLTCSLRISLFLETNIDSLIKSFKSVSFVTDKQKFV